MTNSRLATRSGDLYTRALKSVPGGVNSNIRLSAPRLFFERGLGARIWDVDGNEYVDYVLGQGPHFLGHANDAINEQVALACKRGMLFGAQHELEIEACELVLDALGWAERVRLGMTGTECVQAALRCARAATGRTRFVRFEGHYHGWLDNVLIRTAGSTTGVASLGQPASQLADCHVIPWNDADAVANLLRSDGADIAAVIMEPMMVNAGGIEPNPGYLQAVRDLCTEHGAALIFDEVITGFRISRGGAAEKYGVHPDLATYGKAMAGGWPVAAIAGSARLMDGFGTGAINHAGTFNASVMAAAAVVATQRQLADDPPYARIEAYGSELMTRLVELAERHELSLHVRGLPSAFHTGFGDPGPVRDYRELNRLDLDRYARFAEALSGHGLWVAGRGIWYVSAAHGPAQLQDTLARLDAAITEQRP